MVTEASYQRARDDPAYRQEFLDSIDLGAYAPYVKGVVSSKDPDILTSFLLTNPIMATKPGKSGAVVAVYPRAYDYDLNDFLGALLHHECRHAMQYYFAKRPSLLHPKERLRDLFQTEVDAYHNELMHIHELPHTEQYRDTVLTHWQENLLLLEVLDNDGLSGVWTFLRET